MLDAQFWKDIAFGFWETTYMVFLSTLFAYILGMPLGVLLVVTDENGLKPIPWLNKTIGFIVNILRSVPFVILLIMIIPFTRFLVGTASGSFPTIVPLTVAAFPFIARLVEGSLKELDGGIDKHADRYEGHDSGICTIANKRCGNRNNNDTFLFRNGRHMRRRRSR